MKHRTITIWEDDMQSIEHRWNIYRREGYSIKDPITVKFNWKRLRVMYTCKLHVTHKKHLTYSEELEELNKQLPRVSSKNSNDVIDAWNNKMKEE